MKFESRKDLFFSLFILGVNSFLIAMAALIHFTGIEEDEYLPLIVILGVIGLLFWLFFGTSYELSKEEFIYRSGPFRGRISTDRITEIIKGKTLWVGFKPATSRKGLIIKYDKYNQIYISPKSNETFIEKLLELNSGIRITEY